MNTKICTDCNKKRQIKNFHKRPTRKSRSKFGKPYRKNSNNTGKSQYQAICKFCWKIRSSKYYSSHKKQCNNTTKQWKLNHKDNVLNYERIARLKIIEFFGNKCCKCGFSNERALQIDHVSGDGYKDRRSYRARTWALLKLIKTNPKLLLEKYQLLCANCNWIKRVENKEYIHKKLPNN